LLASTTHVGTAAGGDAALVVLTDAPASAGEDAHGVTHAHGDGRPSAPSRGLDDIASARRTAIRGLGVIGGRAALLAKLDALPTRPGPTTWAVRTVAALGMRAFLRGYHRLSIEGRENLPLGCSFVLVANHQSHLDAPALAAAIRLPYLHQTYPAAAADYFFRTVPRSILFTVMINGLPFHRRRGASRSLAVCKELLRSGGNILILFPEGTRSPDGELGRFRSGIGRLVMGSQIPVVPCHLEGAFRALPKGASLPRPVKLTLRIGTPRSYGHLAPGRTTIRHICTDLREAVVALSGREDRAPKLPAPRAAP
jgi:1-acyl-sn-glycerol-3-phosphate acyltransferase